MKNSMSQILYWTPRIICLLFIPFIMMFSLDVFEHTSSAKDIVIGLLMHNIPAFLIMLVLWFAWRIEWVGAAVFGALGIFYIVWAWGRFHISAYIFIFGPLFLMALLFLIGWMKRDQIRMKVRPSKSTITPPAGTLILVLLSSLIFGNGCASFKSNLGNIYDGPVVINDSEPVTVCFVFSHARQMVGFDVIPKLDNQRQRPSSFDDILLDAQREFTNLKNYATYTEESSDVNNPERRALKDSLIKANDFALKMRIEKKNGFVNYFLGGLGSAASATILPIPYYKNYTVTADLYNKSGKLLKTYNRNARMTKWVEALLIFVYPFCPEARVEEEIYMEFMHDIFKQIECDKVLQK